MKVLIADDSALSRALLRSTLQRWGYDVVVAEDGDQAWKLLSDPNAPLVAILDWVMPGLTGPEVCRKVRETRREPYTYILLLTSKNTKEETVEGMDSGADDYVVKPFELAELRARIAALLRRGTRDKKTDAILQLNDLRLDSDTYQVEVENNQIQLTSTEHRLLRYLMEHPNQALSPSHLLQAVWEYPPNTGDPDLVRAHVRNLRAKIERGARRKYIRTIHGVGYMIST